VGETVSNKQYALAGCGLVGLATQPKHWSVSARRARAAANAAASSSLHDFGV
jgi:hypothetical protein